VRSLGDPELRVYGKSGSARALRELVWGRFRSSVGCGLFVAR
jgi:hypothetical protein